MKLFDYVKLPVPIEIEEHEESGRFVPLTQIRSSADLQHAIADLVPLLHAPPEVADPIRYVFSEVVRNVLEHSYSAVGAIVCAQYYKNTNRISIGVADSGVGIFRSMHTHHAVRNDKDAILLALQPGITGTTRRFGGTETNAGAGLFFTKSIAALSRNFFLIYSGKSAFKLLRGPQSDATILHADASKDHHRMLEELPRWNGTVVGIDINVTENSVFAELLNEIRKAYFTDVKRKKNYARKIRFKK